MVIETCDVKQVKLKRESAAKEAKKTQQIEERRDKKFRIRAQKVPLNKNAQSFNSTMEQHNCEEFKLMPSLALVEGVSRGVPCVLPANGERLKMRLLKSPDMAYLTEKIFANYDVENDKLKLLLTILAHTANEVICYAGEHHKAEVVAEPSPTNELQPKIKKESPKAVSDSGSLLQAQQSIKVETKD